jgi:hypothetical protein
MSAPRADQRKVLDRTRRRLLAVDRLGDAQLGFRQSQQLLGAGRVFGQRDAELRRQARRQRGGEMRREDAFIRPEQVRQRDLGGIAVQPLFEEAVVDENPALYANVEFNSLEGGVLVSLACFNQNYFIKQQKIEITKVIYIITSFGRKIKNDFYSPPSLVIINLCYSLNYFIRPTRIET